MIFAPLPPLRTGPRSLRSLVLQSAYWNLAALHRRTLAARTRVIGITGSLGKTTTTSAMIHALGCRPDPLLGWNGGRHIATNILGIRPGDRHRVVEAGIEIPGQMITYAKLIRPDIVVVTCIASEHRSSFETLENTRAEKLLLVRELRPGGTGVFNGDDPHTRWMAEQTDARKIFFGFNADNDVRAEEVRREADGSLSFTLLAGGHRVGLHSKLIGRHQIYALLAAAAVALHEKIPVAQIVAGLEAVTPHECRLEVVRIPGGITLIRDEFKSTIETVDAALDTLAEFPAHRRIVVIGELPEMKGTGYPVYRRIGARIAGFADFAINVGRNRQSYASGAVAAGFPRENFLEAESNTARAAELLRELLQPGDVVLIKGRTDQKLDRVALRLMGREVTCNISRCDIKKWSCQDCQMLNRADAKPAA